MTCIVHAAKVDRGHPHPFSRGSICCPGYVGCKEHPPKANVSASNSTDKTCSCANLQGQNAMDALGIPAFQSHISHTHTPVKTSGRLALGQWCELMDYVTEPWLFLLVNQIPADVAFRPRLVIQLTLIASGLRSNLKMIFLQAPLLL